MINEALLKQAIAEWNKAEALEAQELYRDAELAQAQYDTTVRQLVIYYYGRMLRYNADGSIKMPQAILNVLPSPSDLPFLGIH